MLGLVVGLAAGVLSYIERSSVTEAIRHGALVFGGTVTLVILIMTSLGSL
ncbi:hypothetical protein [Streptomyces sp. NPDC059010]